MQSKLTIKKLSNSGVVLEEAVCLSGCVNVFRSKVPEKLENYEHALFNVTQGSAFQIELDGQVINPLDGVACVGVGTFKTRSGALARQVLSNAGYKTSAIDSMSDRYGLRNLLDKKVETLDESELRKIELLVAAKQKAKIIFIKDPFAPLDPTVRDIYAQLVTDSAVRDQKIVVISRLSERPESWVGNVAIARIDLDLNRQATIGFDPRLIERIRSEVITQPSSKGKIIPLPTSNGSKKKFNHHIIATVAIVVVLGTLGSAIGGRLWQQPPPSIENTSPPQPVSVIPETPPPAQETPIVLALSMYPPEISQSIQSAFMEEDELPTLVDESSDIIPVSPQQKRDNTEDIFKAIEDNNLTQDYSSPSSEVTEQQAQDDSSVESWEKTREEMRRRFLESISNGAGN